MARILSVDGGGYLGLATAAFIAGIEHHFDRKLCQEFDLFCGTSTGAIIALALAAGKSGQDVQTLYIDLGAAVFRPRWGAAASFASLFTPKFAIEPLRGALEKAFDNMTLGDLLARGKKVVIPSFCVSTGRPRIFKTDHSPNLSLHSRYRLVDVALASAAAPVFFPLVKIRNPTNQIVETFCDGGVVSNHPALIAYAEAISELQSHTRDVRLLSLSTPRMDLAEQEPVSIRRGLWQWGESLASVFVDGGAHASGEILRRIVSCCPDGERPLFERIELQNKHRLRFDDVGTAATAALELEGATQAAANDIRRRVAPFFS